MRFRLHKLVILGLCVTRLATHGQEKRDPGAALYGEWRIVEMEMVYNKTHEVIPIEAGSFFFEPGKFAYALSKEDCDRFVQDKRWKNAFTQRCAIKELEIDNWLKVPWDKKEHLGTLRYELLDDRLKVLWPASVGDGPADFDEAYKDRRYTLYVLKMVP
jgi:hypothetical protein